MRINGDAIRAARKAKGMSREQLAVHVGVSYATIGNAERGETDTAAGTAWLIAETLGVPIQSLFVDEAVA
jgi:transcriptional regulator with XRE-family HTH domain